MQDSIWWKFGSLWRHNVYLTFFWKNSSSFFCNSLFQCKIPIKTNKIILRSSRNWLISKKLHCLFYKNLRFLAGAGFPYSWHSSKADFALKLFLILKTLVSYRFPIFLDYSDFHIKFYQKATLKKKISFWRKRGIFASIIWCTKQTKKSLLSLII